MTRLEKNNSVHPSNAGFTLLENLIIILIIGLLSTIVAPTWLGFINRYRLTTSTQELQWAFKMAQANAKRDKIAWQISIQETPQHIRLALHPATVPPVQLPASTWTSLEPGILIDDKQPNPRGKLETTLRKINPTTNKVSNSSTMYRVLFNYKGCPVYNPTDECAQTSLLALGRIGLYHPSLARTKRCVIVSTVLGVTRIGREQAQPSDDRYCY